MKPNATKKHVSRPLRLAAIAMSSAAAIALLVGVNASQPTSAAPAAVAAPWAGYADLVEQVMQSVVAIKVDRTASNLTVADQPEWREFRRFGEEGPQSEQFKRFMERFLKSQAQIA